MRCKNQGLILLDMVMALVILALVFSAMFAGTHHLGKGQRIMAERRAAVRLAEAELSRMQSHEVLQPDQAVKVTVLHRQETTAWCEVQATQGSVTVSLVGMVPLSSLTTEVQP